MVEGTGLENRQACKRLVGSNPTPSASYYFNILVLLVFIYSNSDYPYSSP